jgi:hypothetical protein
MDPAQLIPTPDTIPVAWPWLKVLLMPVFMVHLLFMNALLGSTIIGWAQCRRRPGPGLDQARRISRHLPFYMAFTINFGVAALLFMQVMFGQFFYTSSILMALWWLSALALVLAAYAAAYWIEFRFQALGRLRSLVWSAMAAGLLLVALIFTNNMTLMLDPPSWPRYFEHPGGTLWHWDDPTLLPRYLHFVTASVAVAGLVLAVVNRKGTAQRTAHYLQWFTMATALQIVWGGWFFVTVPTAVRLALTGGDVRATAFFAAALAGFLLALGCGIRQRLWPAVGATLLTIAAMVLVRDALRTICLAPYFSVAKLAVRPQYTPLLVFGLFAAAGLAAVLYLARLYGKGVRVP